MIRKAIGMQILIEGDDIRMRAIIMIGRKIIDL